MLLTVAYYIEYYVSMLVEQFVTDNDTISLQNDGH